jgi:DNA-binding response OmpR family regulator
LNGVALLGRSILVLEDEPLIAMEIVEAFRDAGASVFIAHSLKDALPVADHPGLSAAVLDFRVADGDAAVVCQRLNARDIPFVLYSGREPEPTALKGGVYVPKPTRSDDLISTVARLLH